MATKSRMTFLDRAAADKTLVGSYHLPFLLRARMREGAATAGCRQIGSGRADDAAGRGRCASQLQDGGQGARAQRVNAIGTPKPWRLEMPL